MNRFWLFSGLAFAVAVIVSGGPARGDEKFPVAVLNADKAIKQYPPLQERLIPLKRDAAELDKSAQLRQVELETTQRQLARTPPNTPEHEKLQILVVKLQTELRQFIERERRNLAKREAAVFVEVYREMEEEVRKICKERGIKLVVRQNDASLDDEKVEEVLKAINRAILYEDGLDITDEVMDAMTKRAEKK